MTRLRLVAVWLLLGTSLVNVFCGEVRPLSVSMVTTFPMRSHASALEFSADLISRGHDVSFVSFDSGLHLADKYTGVRKLSLGEAPLSAQWVREMFMSHATVEDFATEFNQIVHIFTTSFKPIFYGLERIYASEPLPDVFVCDVFADACMDFANSRGVPFVVQVVSGPGIFGYGDAPYVAPAVFGVQTNMTFAERLKYKFVDTALLIASSVSALDKVDAQRRELGLPVPSGSSVGLWQVGETRSNPGGNLIALYFFVGSPPAVQLFLRFRSTA